MLADAITLEDCWFYHSMDLPKFGNVQGQWDLRGRFAEYTGRVNLTGRSVLDVGTASGFLSFEAERAGAALVYSFDAERVDQYAIRPGAEHDPEFFRKMRNSYWLAHGQLRSKAIPVFGDIFCLSRMVPACDVVILGQILVHLRDPLGVIEQAALSCREHLIIAEGIFEATHAAADYLGGREAASWWHLSVPLYEQFLGVLGFDLVSVDKRAYFCTVTKTSEQIWTLIAKRRHPRFDLPAP